MKLASTGSLTTSDGIRWCFLSHNGRVAFGHNRHAIFFEPRTGMYHLKQNGETMLIRQHASEVLREASAVVWDFYAAQIQPSWEQVS